MQLLSLSQMLSSWEEKLKGFKVQQWSENSFCCKLRLFQNFLSFFQYFG